MSAWIRIIAAMLNRGACWENHGPASRCTLY